MAIHRSSSYTLATMLLLAVFLLSSLVANAARVIEVNEQEIEGTSSAILYIFGSKPTHLSFTVSDRFSDTTLRIVSGSGPCSNTAPILGQLRKDDVNPSTMKVTTVLRRSDLGFSPSNTRDYQLCYGSGEDSGMKLRVLPEMSDSSFGRTNAKRVFAPVRSISSTWERRVFFSFSQKSLNGRLNIQLGDHDAYAVDKEEECTPNNRKMSFTPISSNVAEFYVDGVSSEDVKHELSVCVHGSKTGLSIVPLGALVVGTESVSSEHPTYVHMAADSAVNIPIRGITPDHAKDGDHDDKAEDHDVLANSGLKLGLCDLSPEITTHWKVSMIDTDPVTMRVEAKSTAPSVGYAASLCANMTGLSFDLGLALSSFQMVRVKGVNAGVANIDNSVSQIFDSSGSGNSDASNLVEWPVTLNADIDHTTVPNNMDVFLSTNTDCSSHVVSTSDGHINTATSAVVDPSIDADKSVSIYFPADWVTSTSLATGTNDLPFLCGRAAGVGYRLKGFRIAPFLITDVSGPSGSSPIVLLGGETDPFQLSVTGSFPPTVKRVSLSLGCSSQFSTDFQSVTSSASTTYAFTITTQMIQEHPSFAGKFCLKAFDATNTVIATGFVGSLRVVQPAVIAENGANALFTSDRSLPITVSLPPGISLNEVRFNLGCTEQAVNTRALSTGTNSSNQPYTYLAVTADEVGTTAALKELCWGLVSPGSGPSAVPTKFANLAVIQVIPAIAPLSETIVTIASPYAQVIEFTVPQFAFSLNVGISVAFLSSCTYPQNYLHVEQVFQIPSTGSIILEVPSHIPGTFQVCSALVPLSFVPQETNAATTARRQDQTPTTTSVFDETVYYFAEHRFSLGTVSSHNVAIGSAESSSHGALSFPQIENYMSTTGPLTVAATITPALPAGSSISLFVSTSDDDEVACEFGAADGNYINFAAATSISLPVQAVRNSAKKRALICARLTSPASPEFAEGDGYKPLGVSVSAFSLSSADGMDLVFGTEFAQAPFTRIGLSVLAERQRVVEFEGFNLHTVNPLQLRLYHEQIADCAAAGTPDLIIDMDATPDGTATHLVLPHDLHMEVHGVCLSVTAPDGSASAVGLNIFFTPLPFSAFDNAHSDTAQQNAIVAAVGLTTYTRVIKATDTSVLPISTDQVTFAVVNDKDLDCATVNKSTQLITMRRLVDAVAYVTVEVSPPMKAVEGKYAVCAKVLDSSGTDEVILATGINVVILDLVIAGRKITEGGVIAAKVKEPLEMHITSRFVDRARISLAITDGRCGAALTGTNAIGIPRTPVGVTGCGVTGLSAIFPAPTTASTKSVTTQLCIALSSSSVPALGETNLRFAPTGINVVVVSNKVPLSLFFDVQPSSQAASGGALPIQPIIGLQAGNVRMSSLPFDLLAVAEWINLDTEETTGERYVGQFSKGDANIDFSVVGSPIQFKTSVYAVTYALQVTVRGTSAVTGVNSTSVVRQECPSSTLLAEPYTQRCTQCPSTASCTGSSKMSVVGSFWRPSNTSVQFYSCAEPYGGANCESMTETGACKAGHHAPRCSECEADYGKSSSGSCVKCPSSGASGFIVFLAVLGVICMFLILLDSTMRCRKSDQFPTYMKILLNHITVSAVVGDMSRYYPNFVRVFFNIQKQISQPSPEFASYDCAVGGDWYSKLYVVNLMPIVLTVVIAICVGAYKLTAPQNEEQAREWRELKKKKKQDDGDDEEPESETRLLTFGHCFGLAVVAVFFIAYPVLVSWNMRVHRCDDIDYGTVDQNGNVTSDVRSYFFYDRTKLCTSSEHEKIQKLAIFLIILWGIGIPATMALMYRLNARVLSGYVNASRTFTFFVGGYRRQVWFWEIFIFVRKFLILLVVSYVKDPSLQTIIASWVIAVSFFAQERVKPFEYKTVDIMEKVSLLCIFVTLSLSLLFDFATGDNAENVQANGMSDGGYAVSIIILIMNILVMLWMFYVLVPEGIRKIRKQLHRKRNSLTKTLPKFLHPIFYKIILSDIIMINVVGPEGDIVVIPKKEDDLASDWDNDEEAQLEPADDMNEPEPDRKKPAPGADEVTPKTPKKPSKTPTGDEDEFGSNEPTSPTHKKMDPAMKKKRTAAISLVELPGELDETDPKNDNDEDAKKRQDELSAGFKAGRKAATTVATTPDEMLDDPELPNDERERRQKLRMAFRVGRKAQNNAEGLEELDETEDDVKRRNELKAAFLKGRKGGSPTDIPAELDDEAPGLSDEEKAKRKEQHNAFKKGRRAQRAHDLVEDLIDDEVDANRQKQLRDAFESGKKAKDDSNDALPEELRDDVSGLTDEEVAFRRKLQAARKAGKVARTYDDLVEELDDPSRPDDGQRKAFEQGRLAAQKANKKKHKMINEDVPDELRDDVDGLSDDEAQERRRLQAIFRKSRDAKRAEELVEELENTAGSDADKKKIRDAFERAKKAKSTDEDIIPNELRDDVDGLSDEDMALRRRLQQAYKAGRAAKTASELEEPGAELLNSDARKKAFEAGKKAAKNKPKGAEDAIPDELRDDVDGLSDEDVKHRRRLQAMYRQGRAAKKAQDDMEELEDDPSLSEEDRKQLSAVFSQGRKAQKKAQEDALPEELRVDPVTPHGVDDAGDAQKLRNKKRSAFLKGRAAARQAAAIVVDEYDEGVNNLDDLESAPAAAKTASKGERNSFDELKKQLDKGQRQIDEQLEAMNLLVGKVAMLEDENQRLKKDQKEQVLQASMADEMNAMLESLERLQKENEELRNKGKPGKVFGTVTTKNKLQEWQKKSKEFAMKNNDAVKNIMEEAEKNESSKQAALDAQKKEQEEQLRAKLEAKRAARKKKLDELKQSGDGSGDVSPSTSAAAIIETDILVTDLVKEAVGDAENTASEEQAKSATDEANEKIAVLNDIVVSLNDQQEDMQKKLAEALDTIANQTATIAALKTHAESMSNEISDNETKHLADKEALCKELDAARGRVTELENAEIQKTTGSGAPAAPATQAPPKKQWGKMARMLKSDPTNGLYALCMGAASKKKASEAQQHWQQKMDKLSEQVKAGKVDNKNLQAEIDALDQLFTLTKGLFEESSTEQMQLSEDLARQKRLVTILQRKVSRFEKKDIKTNGNVAVAADDDEKNKKLAENEAERKKRLLEEAEQKSSERKELEAAEKEAQQRLLQEKLEKKRAARKNKTKTAQQTVVSEESVVAVQEAVDQLVTASVSFNVEDSTVVTAPSSEQEEKRAALQKELDAILTSNDPAKLREFAVGLQEAVSGLKASNVDLTERYAAVVERLASLEELNANFMDDKKEGAELTATPSENLGSQLDAVTKERDELRAKLDQLGNNKFTLKRAGDVQKKIKVWKAGAAARNSEREDATAQVMKESEKDAAAKKAREEAEQRAQQDQIKEKLRKKREKKRQAQKAAAEAAGQPVPSESSALFAGEASILADEGVSVMDAIRRQEEQEATAAAAQTGDAAGREQDLYKDPKKAYETVVNLRAVIEGMEEHSQGLIDKYSAAETALEGKDDEIELLKKQLERMEELAIQADSSASAQTDELQVLSATVKDLQQQNEAMKAGILDPNTGATASDLLHEMEILKRRIGLLESETGMKTGDSETAKVASHELRGKLAGWTKSAKRTKKKRDDVVSNLISEAETKTKMRTAMEDADKDQQMSALEKKLAAKRAARASKMQGNRPGTSGADGSTAVAIDDPSANVPTSNPTAIVDSNGEIILKPRRHVKLGEAAALSVFTKNIKAKRTQQLNANSDAASNVAASSSSDSEDIL